MSHLIEVTESGFAKIALPAGRPGWHHLGQTIPEGMADSETVIDLAGLDDRYVLAPLHVKPKNGEYVPVPDYRIIVRLSDSRQYGIVSPNYEVLQPREAFKAMDGWLKDGRMQYESAMSLMDGLRICILARLGEDFLVGGKDPVAPFVLLDNWYDGKTATSVKNVLTRVECANTANMARREKGAEVRIRHTKSLKQRLADADKALNLTVKGQQETFAKFEQLAQMGVSQELKEEIVDLVTPKAEDTDGDRTRARKQRERLDLWRAIQSPPRTVQAAGGNDNRWGLFNIVTDYLDWQQDRRGQDISGGDRGAIERRLTFSLEGAVADTRETVFNRLLIPA